MKTVAASSMPFAEEAFSTLGDIKVLEGRNIGRSDVGDAELLATRSTTKLSRELLEGTPVRFVGSATIGTDHMDIPYMEAAGIRWCYSPGCNANSVAEYVVSALLCLAVRHGFTLRGKTLGIVGVGNVGSLVAERAAALGLRVLLNDPPRQRNEPENAHRFVALDPLLAESDFVTLHIPLTREGQDATFHLAGRTFFERMKPGAVFINAARGAVVDTPALLQSIESKRLSHTVIDTWEGEPDISPTLLHAVDLGTPHIAGYSFEGKVMGTVMVYREACRFLGAEPVWDYTRHMPEPPTPLVELDATGLSDEQVLWDAVRRIYDIERDDRALRNRLGTVAMSDHFDTLRGTYPMRREFRYTAVRASDNNPELIATLYKLQFQTA